MEAGTHVECVSLLVFFNLVLCNINSGAETDKKYSVSAPELIVLCGFLLKLGAKNPIAGADG